AELILIGANDFGVGGGLRSEFAGAFTGRNHTGPGLTNVIFDDASIFGALFFRLLVTVREFTNAGHIGAAAVQVPVHDNQSRGAAVAAFDATKIMTLTAIYLEVELRIQGR